VPPQSSPCHYPNLGRPAAPVRAQTTRCEGGMLPTDVARAWGGIWCPGLPVNAGWRPVNGGTRRPAFPTNSSR
jgi:hypothetical protein